MLQNPETQEDVNPSSSNNAGSTTLWREIKNRSASQSRPLFAPRLIIFDTKENVAFTQTEQSKSSSAAAYSHKQNAALWDGKVDNLMDEEDLAPSATPVINPISATSPPTKDYSRWADFITWKLAGENIHLLPNFSHNAETGQLDSYSQGIEIWKMLEDGVEDGIRKYSEECDHLEVS